MRLAKTALEFNAKFDIATKILPPPVKRRAHFARIHSTGKTILILLSPWSMGKSEQLSSSSSTHVRLCFMRHHLGLANKALLLRLRSIDEVPWILSMCKEEFAAFAYTQQRHQIWLFKKRALSRTTIYRSYTPYHRCTVDAQSDGWRDGALEGTDSACHNLYVIQVVIRFSKDNFG